MAQISIPAAGRLIGSWLPDSLRRLVLADVREDLRRAVTDHLLADGTGLLHLESRRRQPCSRATGDGEQDCAAIAEAAHSLLGGKSGDHKIELLLPSSEFLATSQAMPGVARENLAAAFDLQRETILPACEQDCVLAIAAPVQECGEEQRVTALWFPAERLELLFAAMQQQGLNLVAVRPRILAAAATTGPCRLMDEEEEQITAIAIEDGDISQWLQIHKADLAQQALAEQWQSALGRLTSGTPLQTCDAEAFSKGNGDRELDGRFYPRGALQAQRRTGKGYQLLSAAVLVAGLLLLSCIPFLLQSFELRQAQARLASTYQLSADARTDRSVVVDFEEQWSPVNDYPVQALHHAMFRLQELLGSERLSSLELKEGLIRIQGNSPDPQAILQRLEQDPMFTEVVFSRATSNSRYYIDLRLATVNFPAYMVRHFPDQT